MCPNAARWFMEAQTSGHEPAYGDDRWTLQVSEALRDLFQDHAGIRVLATDVPAIEAYPRAATRGLPVHRVEHRQPPGRVAPASLDTMRALASELFPQWQDRFAEMSGRPPRPLDAGRSHGERT
jgi:chromosome partitioning related protein ParA